MRAASRETIYLIGLFVVSGALLFLSAYLVAGATSRARITGAVALAGATIGALGLLVYLRLRRRRPLEADLQMAAQLRGLTGLYLGIAHDLKAPLNAMVLNVELLKRSLDHGDENAAAQHRRIEILEEELRRLQRSVERILTHTAPVRPEIVRYDLAELVSEIGELLAPQARQQKVALQVRLPQKRLLTRGCPDLTKQALINLAVNGFEALTDGGELQLEADARDGEIVLRVADDGPGIPRTVVRRVYDLHFTTKETGTGLGLYVTRAMIESQGGSLRVAETGESGTTFELRLPTDPVT